MFTKIRKLKKWQAIILFCLLFIFMAGVVYTYILYNSVTKTAETMHEPIKRTVSEKRKSEITLEKKDPFSVLVLGVDERSGDIGRSDTILVITVNPNLNSVKMLSIPRDTRTEIIGKGKDDKINHAYAFGGPEMSIETVESFLDIPIDYYIKLNMEGFKDIVDAVGGITVNNDLDFTEGGIHFKEGEIKLTGQEALSFVRMRYNDPRGDFGRQQRQRQVIQGVMNKGASIASLAKTDEIFNAIGKNVKTNFSLEEMIDIQQHYSEARKQIDQLTISGQGSIINDIYYYIVPNEEKSRLHAELLNHLELN